MVASYFFEIDDYPLSIDPFISTDFNFKIISDFLYYRLRDEINCKIVNLDKNIIEIRLFDYFLERNIYSENFVKCFHRHIHEKTPYFKYLIFIEKVVVVSQDAFRLYTRTSLDFFKEVFQSHFIIPVTFLGKPIKKGEFIKKQDGFKIISEDKTYNFLVNKSCENTIGFLKEGNLDLTAFSHPNELLLTDCSNNSYLFDRYKLESVRGSLVYYLKFFNQQFGEYFEEIRKLLHEEIKNNPFLIPVSDFLGSESKNRIIKTPNKRSSVLGTLKIGYSNYFPNKKIAVALQKVLLKRYAVSSVIVEFDNLQLLIENMNNVDIVLSITFPVIDNLNILLLDILPDVSSELQKQILKDFQLGNFTKIASYTSFTRSMLPIFCSQYYYFKKLERRIEVSSFGEIIIDDD